MATDRDTVRNTCARLGRQQHCDVLTRHKLPVGQGEIVATINETTVAQVEDAERAVLQVLSDSDSMSPRDLLRAVLSLSPVDSSAASLAVWRLVDRGSLEVRHAKVSLLPRRT